jgi:crossover junction endodeoxyribonuclease RuvC
VKIVGLDLSMTATGYAYLQTPDLGPSGHWHLSTIKTKGTDSDSVLVTHVRLLRICSEVTERVWQDQPDLIVMEGPAFSSSSGKAHDRSGLWWLIYDALRAREIPLAVVKPNTRTMYATGKGNASKDTVMAAASRRYLDAPILNNNEADAVILAAMGARWCNEPIEPALPMTHLRAMTVPEWPATVPA